MGGANKILRQIIFLVDDNEVNLMACKKALPESYKIYTFTSGLLLFKALERLIPDLILLDVEMPEMGGYDVLAKLKEGPTTSHIPVIFLTALRDEESELKGLSMGGMDYITKPFSPPLLRQRVELHLLVQSQKRELIEFNKDLDKTVREKSKEVVELKNAVLETVAELVESRDLTTGNHIKRTSLYIKILLDGMKKRGLYIDELLPLDEELIVQSSQLHDVGKITVSDTILLKPDRLTDEEFDIIKSHTIYGEKILNQIMERVSDSTFLEYACIFAISHHEKWDGSGYPKGLKRNDIPLLGRIMAIADVYDALVSDRPYKKPMIHSEAVEIIKKGSGTHFDPALIDVFAENHEEFEIVVQKIGTNS